MRTKLDDSGHAISKNSNCGVRVAEGQHRTYVTDFIRDARAGGCAVGVPPDNLGFRLVREQKSWVSQLSSGLSKALSIARDRAGIGPGERVSIELYPRPRTILQSLTMQDEAWVFKSALPAPIAKAIRDFSVRERFSKEGVILWTGDF